MSHCSLISTRSNGKPFTQSMLDRYEQTTPIPNLPWWICWRWLVGSWQSSPNMTSKCWLKVSNASSPSALFMTGYILSSFVPVWTEGGKPFESAWLCLTSDRILTTVGILWKRKRDSENEHDSKISRELPCKDLERLFQSQICCPLRCQWCREPYQELPIKRKKDRVRTSTTGKIHRELPYKGHFCNGRVQVKGLSGRQRPTGTRSRVTRESSEWLSSRAGSRVRDLGWGINDQGISLREGVMEVLDWKS